MATEPVQLNASVPPEDREAVRRLAAAYLSKRDMGVIVSAAVRTFAALAPDDQARAVQAVIAGRIAENRDMVLASLAPAVSPSGLSPRRPKGVPQNH
jgi:hypothetical protein